MKKLTKILLAFSFSLSTVAHAAGYSANDPRYLGDVTIQTAREVAAKRSVPTFIDAGTTLVTSANVGPFDLSALFASYRPKIFSEGK